MPLEKVRDKVAKAVIADLQNQKARETAEQWLKTLDTESTLEGVARKNGLEVKSTGLFGKRGTIAELGHSPDIVEAAFKLEKGQVHPGVLKGNDGYYLISLREKEIPDDAQVDKNIKEVKQQLKGMKQNAAYGQWMAALKAKSDIRIEPRVLE